MRQEESKLRHGPSQLRHAFDSSEYFSRLLRSCIDLFRLRSTDLPHTARTDRAEVCIGVSFVTSLGSTYTYLAACTDGDLYKLTSLPRILYSSQHLQTVSRHCFLLIQALTLIERNNLLFSIPHQTQNDTMAATTPTAAGTVVVHKDWETLLDARIDLYKEASKGGSSKAHHILTIVEHVNPVDHHASALKAMASHPKAREAMQTYSQLEDITLNATGEFDKEFEEVHQGMEGFKETEEGKSETGWEKYLDDVIDEQKKKSDARWESLRASGKKIISQLPESAQGPAAGAFGLALKGVSEFIDKAISWLKDAFETVVEWIKKAWEKIIEFANDVKNWFVGAWNAVKVAFGGRSMLLTEAFSEHSQNFKPVANESSRAAPNGDETTASPGQ